MTCRDPDRCADVRKLARETDKPELLSQTLGMDTCYPASPAPHPPSSGELMAQGTAGHRPPALCPQSGDTHTDHLARQAAGLWEARWESCLRPPLTSKSWGLHGA